MNDWEKDILYLIENWSTMPHGNNLEILEIVKSEIKKAVCETRDSIEGYTKSIDHDSIVYEIFAIFKDRGIKWDYTLTW